jgi:hypothetical protein
MRQTAVRLGIAGAIIAAVVVAAAITSRPPEVSVPSPTPVVTASPTVAPTPSPTASPTPSPTLAPTVAPTAPRTPEPTPSTVAGDRLIPLYFEIRPMFPVLPPAPVILFDSWAGGEENAAFHGLTSQGAPQFSVRHDFVLDKPTAAHEIGHAYQKTLERLDPSRDYLALYWAFRGFPGTWQQALAQSEAQPTFSGKWIHNPYESWAEAFRAAVTLEVKEKTLDYGKTIDPMATRKFFQSLPNK